MLKSARLHSRGTRSLVGAALLFLLTLGIFAAALFTPSRTATALAQGQEATPTPAARMQGGMMGSGTMSQGMSMAEMGAMMDSMMANMQGMMADTQTSGAMSMSDMGQMMQMMGMMHQQMGQMQMMMGAMMGGGMESAADMGEGMMDDKMSMQEMGNRMQMMSMMHQQMAMMHMMGAMMTGKMMGQGEMGEGMSMHDMGNMMSMMGMMHQQMAMMHMMGAMMTGMMMGGMMDGDTMGQGMMGQGMGSQGTTPEAPQAAPEATATPEPTSTATPDSAPTETTVPGASAATSGHPDHPLATTSQSATAGAVTVKVTPLIDDEILEIAFAVTLETHSVDLNYDLAEQAKLIIGEAEFTPTRWEPNARDGHHVAGTLAFTIDHPAHAALGEVENVTLDLGEIDGQPVTLRFAVAE